MLASLFPLLASVTVRCFGRWRGLIVAGCLHGPAQDAPGSSALIIGILLAGSTSSGLRLAAKGGPMSSSWGRASSGRSPGVVLVYWRWCCSGSSTSALADEIWRSAL